MPCKICGQPGVNSRTCRGKGIGHVQSGGAPVGDTLSIRVKYYNEDGYIQVVDSNINETIRATQETLSEYRAIVQLEPTADPFVHNMTIIYRGDGDENTVNHIIGLVNTVYVDDMYAVTVA